ncbi:MAG: 3-hydroxyacyl-CoA dehydrogenase NAD-binding domain-containing protein, partial [Alphaproteobacteria bacterium]
AMGCAFRIATVDTKFGLPEVLVGLIPGAGGSQRLPRLVGAEVAAQMCSTGVSRKAVEMLTLGAIDRITEGDLLRAAVDFARETLPRPTPVSQRQVSPPPNGYFEQKRAALSGGQVSPLHNLNAVEWACKTDFPTGQARERELHVALRNSAESRALRHAFFAERTVSKPDMLRGITPLEINTVVIVGGGLMGAGIATSCLFAGLNVTIIERDSAAAEAGAERVRSLLDGALKRGKIDADRHAEQLARFSASDTYDAAENADLAIEAVFEDLNVKREVFTSLAAVMRADAILATNTSYLNPEDIFAGTENPSRCVGLHFFSPAHIMKLLEIVKTPDTSLHVLATCFTLGKRLRKIGVLSGICDGFIGNRMLAAYRRQADYLLADGCLPYQIDAAMRAFGMPMGPYELQDLTGLQIAWANRKRQAETRDPAQRYIGIADTLCEMDRLGQRSGKGWYSYENGNRKPMRDPDVEALINVGNRQNFTEDEIINRMLAILINEGALIVEEGIAERSLDVDMVQIHGYGFPRWRGGPMQYAQEVGIDEIAHWMRLVAEQSPDSWKTSELLG